MKSQNYRLLFLFAILRGLRTALAVNGSAPAKPCVCNRFHECFRAELCTCRRPYDNENACLCTEPGNPFWSPCADDTECCGDPNDIWARHLREADYHSLDENEDDDIYDDTLAHCGDLDYEAHLFVEKHLFAIAIPSEEARKLGCPSAVTHAVFGSPEDADSPAQKSLMFWNDQDHAAMPYYEESIISRTHPMGIFKLSELAQAYEKADPSPKGAYDLIVNNCGTYMINLASELGLKVDAKLTSFVARQLLRQSGKELVDRVRQSLNYSTLFHGHRRVLEKEDAMTDDELVELLVESQTSKLYNA